MRRLCLAFVASLALFARVLDAAPTDTQSNETLLNPLAVLSGNPALPRELRLPVGAASAALADVGLGPRAADAIERYGGTDEVRVPTRGAASSFFSPLPRSDVSPHSSLRPPPQP